MSMTTSATSAIPATSATFSMVPTTTTAINKAVSTSNTVHGWSPGKNNEEQGSQREENEPRW
jgi:hypothetical protein